MAAGTALAARHTRLGLAVLHRQLDGHAQALPLLRCLLGNVLTNLQWSRRCVAGGVRSPRGVSTAAAGSAVAAVAAAVCCPSPHEAAAVCRRLPPAAAIVHIQRHTCQLAQHILACSCLSWNAAPLLLEPLFELMNSVFSDPKLHAPSWGTDPEDRSWAPGRTPRQPHRPWRGRTPAGGSGSSVSSPWRPRRFHSSGEIIFFAECWRRSQPSAAAWRPDTHLDDRAGVELRGPACCFMVMRWSEAGQPASTAMQRPSRAHTSAALPVSHFAAACSFPRGLKEVEEALSRAYENFPGKNRTQPSEKRYSGASL